MSVNVGVQAVVELVVTAEDTAQAMGAGDVAVLGTPRVVALCEEATMRALANHLRDGRTSVGSRVELSHLAPVAVGSTVRATATLERTEGRRLIFNVSVSDACGLVAAGRVTRVVVDRDHFVGKAR
ncbi:thioesterase [Acidiferrimicrobium sp. IK]|uniref:thioesterase family protein n=1 Tax=Acidiferrimicrobium sp. IK TaxID=2871700 RepID=UPI0021CB16E1|nr:hotdog domain-containing protein [Acidiferrimicrobium sp. IK]MCU4185352.1 thioesterase [Acidiferrimicrobium sp. IK]